MYRQLFDDTIPQSPPSTVDIDYSLGRARRRTRTRRVLAAAGAAVTVIALAAGTVVAVGGSPLPRTDAATPASSQPVPPADIDRYYPRDLEFYRRFRWDAVSFARTPKDLRAAVEESTAVILARIIDVRPTRRIGDPEIGMAAFVLQPVEVIAGRLRPELAGVVEVEFFGLPEDPAGLAELRGSLPNGLALWFLRWQGEPPPNPKPDAPSPDPVADLTRYTTAHPAMVFAPGPDGLVSAFFLNDPTFTADRAPGEALGFGRLSELVAALRSR
jgi:hypothetical protein